MKSLILVLALALSASAFANNQKIGKNDTQIVNTVVAAKVAAPARELDRFGASLNYPKNGFKNVNGKWEFVTPSLTVGKLANIGSLKIGFDKIGYDKLGANFNVTLIDAKIVGNQINFIFGIIGFADRWELNYPLVNAYAAYGVDKAGTFTIAGNKQFIYTPAKLGAGYNSTN